MFQFAHSSFCSFGEKQIILFFFGNLILHYPRKPRRFSLFIFFQIPLGNTAKMGLNQFFSILGKYPLKESKTS